VAGQGSAGRIQGHHPNLGPSQSPTQLGGGEVGDGTPRGASSSQCLVVRSRQEAEMEQSSWRGLWRWGGRVSPLAGLRGHVVLCRGDSRVR
jgi:hypothetical protein